MENNKRSIKENILESISSGKVSMRPKIFFTLQIAALALLAFAVLSISIIIVNFIFFSIRINSEDVFLGFGPRGILAFIYFFPWTLFLLDTVLIIALESLTRRFRFGNKIPVLYLLGGLLALILIAGIVIDRGTPLNDHLLIRAGEHGLPPPFGYFYLQVRRPPPDTGFCKCTITAINGNVLTLKPPQSSATIMVVLPHDDPRATTSALQVGDTVFVAGDLDDGVIRAFGVRQFPREESHEYDWHRE
jgi:hypothetical protein